MIVLRMHILKMSTTITNKFIKLCLVYCGNKQKKRKILPTLCNWSKSIDSWLAKNFTHYSCMMDYFLNRKDRSQCTTLLLVIKVISLLLLSCERAFMQNVSCLFFSSFLLRHTPHSFLSTTFAYHPYSSRKTISSSLRKTQLCAVKSNTALIWGWNWKFGMKYGFEWKK